MNRFSPGVFSLKASDRATIRITVQPIVPTGIAVSYEINIAIGRSFSTRVPDRRRSGVIRLKERSLATSVISSSEAPRPFPLDLG